MSFDKKSVDYTLYYCTDRGLMSSATVEESVEKAIDGGVTVVQLREKDCSSREFYELALRVKEITAPRNVPLIINDRIDIALAAGADGVHLGQGDMPCTAARKILGEDKLIGISAATVEEAKQAEADGADYLGVGAMFPTNTKEDTRPVSIETLCEIRSAVSIPIVIIGGINLTTVRQFYGLGIDGAAVVSAIAAQADVTAAAKAMRSSAERLKIDQ